MYAWVERAGITVAAVTMLSAAGPAPAQGLRYGLGTPATAAQIAGWDIDVRPDGEGLPPGQGTAEQGETLYAQQCAGCHGDFGEGRGRFPALMGGASTLGSENPVKSIGSFWPYATTIFDYLRRAQPFGKGQSLSADQTYALTAFVLNLNEIVGYDQVVNAASLAAIRMPNRDGFVHDDRPDVPAGAPCMRDCVDEITVVSRARNVDVTPGQRASAHTASALPVKAGDAVGDPAHGKKVFQQCSTCHSLARGEHRVGPSLHRILGRKAGTADGFDRYSDAMKNSGVVWDEASFARYLKAPQDFVPGSDMSFPGIPAAEDVRDLLAYLRQETR